MGKKEKKKKKEDKLKKQKEETKRKSSWFGGWMGSNKKPVYKRGKTVKVVDPKTGDVTTRTDVDIDQFTQAKPVYDEDLDRWVIKDKYGNIDEGDDESSDD